MFQISRSNASQVVLSEVGFNLDGNLTCEITTEGPVIKTATAVKELSVVGEYAYASGTQVRYVYYISKQIL